LEEALENAQQAGLDLIEISPDTDPPVMQISGLWTN
jgi:translation initiation factor IF-3